MEVQKQAAGAGAQVDMHSVYTACCCLAVLVPRIRKFFEGANIRAVQLAVANRDAGTYYLRFLLRCLSVSVSANTRSRSNDASSRGHGPPAKSCLQRPPTYLKFYDGADQAKPTALTYQRNSIKPTT